MGAGTKALELAGLALIGGTIFSFVGMAGSDLRWPVFWSCAAGALAIVVLRKYKRDRESGNAGGSGGGGAEGGGRRDAPGA